MKLFPAISAFTFAAASAIGCDICGCPMVSHPWDPRAGVYFGAAEQFTRFNTIQVDGHDIGNPADQFLESSNTQLFLGYNINRRFGLQVSVPLIHREFRRTVGDHIEHGTESGVGDISLMAVALPVLVERGDFTFQWRTTAGIKLPTGSSDRLAEEESEGDEEEGSLPASGVHGHDLALGSGSVDGIVGTSVFARYQRAFFSAAAQYAIRTKGDHSYRYANDFTWSAGPGVYLKQDRDLTFGVQLVCSGETKRKDKFRGVLAEDTAVTAVYLGPRLIGAWKDRFAADIALDLPLDIDNSALQIVPDYRIRATVSWAF